MSEVQILKPVEIYLKGLIGKVVEDVEKEKDEWRRESEATGL